MAKYRYWTGGDNTGGADNTNWAQAYNTLQGAVTAASSNGAIVLAHYTSQEEVAADYTLTFSANILLISVNKDSSEAITPMDTNGWIGNSTTNRYVYVTGADKQPYVYGITFRTAGTTGDAINFGTTTGFAGTFESCYIWQGTTASGASNGTIHLSGLNGCFNRFINCTFRFGATTQYFFNNSGVAEVIGGTISTDGSIPATLFNSGAQAVTTFRDFDFSNAGITTLVTNQVYASKYFFDRCKLSDGVSALASQTSNPTLGSPEVWFNDCAYSVNGAEVHGFFGYYNALGQVTTDTSIYKTTNSSGNRSWKIVTSANAGFLYPFITPPIDVYHSGTSEITPYLEILRNGSTTAYKNSEVWAQIIAKTTNYVTLGTMYNDRQALSAYLAGTAGADQTTGAGTGEWTGDSGAWSGKIDSGSAFTPLEAGPLTAQICVGVASATVYVDLWIYGLG